MDDYDSSGMYPVFGRWTWRQRNIPNQEHGLAASAKKLIKWLQSHPHLTEGSISRADGKGRYLGGYQQVESVVLVIGLILRDLYDAQFHTAEGPSLFPWVLNSEQLQFPMVADVLVPICEEIYSTIEKAYGPRPKPKPTARNPRLALIEKSRGPIPEVALLLLLVISSTTQILLLQKLPMPEVEVIVSAKVTRSRKRLHEEELEERRKEEQKVAEDAAELEKRRSKRKRVQR